MPLNSVVLVTGGAGYVGSHCCKALTAAGYSPVTYDNLSTGHPELVKWGPLAVGDIRDETRLSQVFHEHRPVAVLHFAALALAGESVTTPEAYFDVNVTGTMALVRTALAHQVRQFVFSSSCAVYGHPDRLPVTEDTRPEPLSPYGETKLAGERFLKQMSDNGELTFLALRYFNAAGADPNCETGEWHEPETHLLPRVILAGLGDLPEIEIFGTDYDTPDGTAIRDYVHVSDLAAAHVLALGYLIEGGPSETVNLGTGAGYSVLEILEAVKAEIGRDIPVSMSARRPGDPAEIYADSRLARETLGFEPRLSDLTSIVKTATAWHRSRRSTVSLTV